MAKTGVSKSQWHFPKDKKTGQPAFKEGAVETSFITAIQDAFRKNHVSSNYINLSLPTKDIIFRSFVIPWMQASEVKGVVDFEAAKYIPFALNELTYAFHHMTITEEDKTKRLRIIFAAIKKDTLATYTNVLKQAGIDIAVMEPAPLSLIRVLTLKQLIPLDKTVAIVEKRDQVGKIIIVNQGIPQFVREFPIKVLTADNQQNEDALAVMNRLINEIRISLDYFNRQDSLLEVTQIIFTTASPSENLAKHLEDNVDLPVIHISGHSILGGNDTDELGFIHAFGAGLMENVATPANLALSKKKPIVTKSARKGSRDIKLFRPSIIAAVLCALALVGTYLLTNQPNIKYQQKIDQLKNELGKEKDTPLNTLTDRTAKTLDRIKNFENIVIDTNAAIFISHIPKGLPQGVWIKEMRVLYETPPEKIKQDTQTSQSRKKKKKNEVEEKIAVEYKIEPHTEVEGYAYSEQSREQIPMINKFHTSLKNNERLTSFFKNISLERTESQRIEDFNITYYKIRLE